MRRFLPFVLLILAGCGSFGNGLRDGFEASLPSAVANVVADKLKTRDTQLSEAIRELPNQLPKPPEPKDNTLEYGLAFLLAKLVGDGVGGLVRSKVRQREA